MDQPIPSKEVMQEDIKNTEKEIEAYTHLVQGFTMLQELPENSPNQYRLDIMRWESARDRCAAFLNAIEKLYKERQKTP